jgi:hypothetical protein
VAATATTGHSEKAAKYFQHFYSDGILSEIIRLNDAKYRHGSLMLKQGIYQKFSKRG